MNVSSYRDLTVWQTAMRLVRRIYAATRTFPKSEQFGLTQQLQRSATSIPSNIAEGHARGGTKDFLRFLSIARGSLAELETQVILAGELELIEREAVRSLLADADEISRMLRGLERSPTQDIALMSPRPSSLAPRP